MDFKLLDVESSSSQQQKIIDDEISTSSRLKSMKYIVSYSLLNLMMAPE